MEDFGTLVRRYRLNRGLTMKAVADAIGVTSVYILDIEKGRKPAPSKEKLEGMIRVFKLRDQKEIDRFYNLAAKSKEKDYVPEDVKGMFKKYNNMPALLRAIKRNNLNKRDIDNIIKGIVDNKKGKERT